jgi:hypothetical protein
MSLILVVRLTNPPSKSWDEAAVVMTSHIRPLAFAFIKKEVKGKDVEKTSDEEVTLSKLMITR